ncbi:MAG: hypothetical protein ACYCPS_00585 [Candidatus Saccharimonadales bacterium]
MAKSKSINKLWQLYLPILSWVILLAITILGYNNFSQINQCDQRLAGGLVHVNNFEQHYVTISLLVISAALITLILTKAKKYKLMHILTVIFILASLAYTLLADLSNNAYNQNVLSCISTNIP